MSTSDVDSDSFSEIEPLDLDDDVIALLDGRASSEAGHPATSSDFDTSYCNDKRSALKQEPSSPALAPQVDEDGFPLMTLTQEETAVLEALEEKYQLSQLSVPLSRNSSDDFVGQPLTQLRGKRRRPLPTGQSLTQPTRSSGTTSLAFNIGNVNSNQSEHSMKTERRDTTATVPLKTKTTPSIPIGKKVKIESKDMIEIPSSDEEEQQEQQVTAPRSVLVNDRSNGRVTKRRKVDISPKSKTQPTTKSVSMTQPLPARSYSISAMVALWDDVDQIEPDVIEISSDSEPEPQPEILAKSSEVKAVPCYTAPPALAIPYSQTLRIDAFFSQYPEFDYKPDAPAVGEFMRLSQAKGWRNSETVKKVAQEEFKTVMSEQFNEIYGLDPDDIKAWQYMLQVLRVDPIPPDLMDCKRVIRSLHVNLVDLVDSHRTKTPPRMFENLAALRAYTKGPKVFPLKVAKAGGVLKFLLRKIRGMD